MNMYPEMLQCSDILHRTAINFQISHLKLNTYILHIPDSSSKLLIQYIYNNNIICVHFVWFFFRKLQWTISFATIYLEYTEKRYWQAIHVV